MLFYLQKHCWKIHQFRREEGGIEWALAKVNGNRQDCLYSKGSWHVCCGKAPPPPPAVSSSRAAQAAERLSPRSRPSWGSQHPVTQPARWVERSVPWGRQWDKSDRWALSRAPWRVAQGFIRLHCCLISPYTKPASSPSFLNIVIPSKRPRPRLHFCSRFWTNPSYNL